LDVLIGEFEQENVRDPFLEVKINFLFFSKVRIIFWMSPSFNAY